MGQTHYPLINPVVDGVPLRELVGAFEIAQGWAKSCCYDGLAPQYYRYGNMEDHFNGYLTGFIGNPNKTVMLVCNCGVYTCWPLQAKIEEDMDSEIVTWRDFEQPFRPERDYSGFGPFVFDWGDYLMVLDDLVEELKTRYPGLET